MADPAFDAFSQGRNTGTKDRVTERRRVDTYTDPNRYQMPPRRRLGVHASNKSMFVTPEKENITALAEGLAKVQPDIMGYIADRQIEANKKQIEYGIQEAMGKAAEEAGDTEFIDNEWKQFGYELYRTQEIALSLGTKLKNATASKNPDEPWDSFYNNWWQSVNEEHPELKTMNPEHLETFNKSIAKSIEVSKAANLVKTHEVQQQRYKEQTQDTIKGQINDYAKRGVFNLDAWEAIKTDNQYMSHWSNEDMNDFLFEGVKQLVHDDYYVGRGLKTIDILRKKRGPNGEIGPLASTKKYKDAVKQLENDVIAKNDKKEAAAVKAKEDNIKLLEKTDKEAENKINDFVGYSSMMKGFGGAESDTAGFFASNVFEQYSDRRVELIKEYGTTPEGIALASKEALEYAEAYASTRGMLNKGWAKGQRKLIEAETNSSRQLYLLSDTPAGKAQLADYYKTGKRPAGTTFSKLDEKRAKVIGRYHYVQTLINEINLTKDAVKVNDNQAAAAVAVTSTDKFNDYEEALSSIADDEQAAKNQDTARIKAETANQK